MKAKFIIILLLLLFGIFESSSFALIKSRVQGTVVDMAGQPIKDVEIMLCPYTGHNGEDGQVGTTKTDGNGFFKINGVENGKYFVTCSKSGYATVNPSYYKLLSQTEGYLQFFELKEGQVKYLKIQMKKGISLRCIIKKKDETGISGFSDIKCAVTQEINLPTMNKTFFFEHPTSSTDENGICIWEGLDPNEKYFINIYSPDGFPHFRRKELTKQNNTLEFSHTFDFTAATKIIGTIIAESKIPEESVDLYLMESGREISTIENLSHNSIYSFFDIPAGNYEIKIRVGYENDEGEVEIKKFPDVLVKVEKNLITVKDIIL